MTQQPPPEPSGPQTQPGTDGRAAGLQHDLFAAVHNLGVRRERDDVWVAGICSGIARRLGIDPVIVRVVLILLVLTSGFGILAYGVAWLLLPTATGPGPLERAAARGTNPVLILGATVILLVMAATSVVGSNWNGFFPQWVVPTLVFGGIFYAIHQRRRGAWSHRPAGSAPPPPSPGSPITTSGSAPFANGTPSDAPAGSEPGFTAFQPTYPAGTQEYYAYAPSSGAYTPAPGSTPSAYPGQYSPGATAAATMVRPPRRPRAGFGVAVLAAALAAAAYGIVLQVYPDTNSSGNPVVVGLAAALGVVAVILLLLGLAGRKAGLTMLLAVILAGATGASAAGLDRSTWQGGIGERSWVPVASSTGPFRLGLGDAELNLRSVPPGTTTSPTRIQAQVGVGELRILVPSGMTVQVDSSIKYGSITLGNTEYPSDGTGNDIKQSNVVGTGAPTVIVEASVNLGAITINAPKAK